MSQDFKVTTFDSTYSQRLAGGDTIIGGSDGSNSGYLGGDVTGSPGDLSVVGLRSQVALSSNINGALGDVLTIISVSPRTATFATPSNTASVGSNAMLRTTGGGGRVTTIAASGAAQTLMIGGANYFIMTLTASCVIGFTGWAATGYLGEIGVRTVENGTGGWTPTFSGVTWIGGTTPAHTTTAGTSTEYVFWSPDGGSTIIGGQLGGSGTSSPLTTKGDLYTYSTTNARLAVGSNGMFMVADPLETVGLRWTTNPAVGELLLSSSASRPPVFGDILTNSSEDDFVYGSR